jgi:hypothetical protein
MSRRTICPNSKPSFKVKTSDSIALRSALLRNADAEKRPRNGLKVLSGRALQPQRNFFAHIETRFFTDVF